jgi:hypothetical protein
MTRWLRGLAPAELEGILLRRPEAVAPPVPRTLGDLAGRLSQHHHVAAAINTLCAPAVQVLEAAQALLEPGDDAVTQAELGAMLGRDAEDPELVAALEVLFQRALAWRVGEKVVLAGPLRTMFEFPLGLGRPAASLLAARTADEVRRIGERLGVRLSGRTKQLAVTEVAAHLGHPERVRALAAEAPEELGEILRELAESTPAIRGEYGYLPTEIDWAIERGLLVSDGWDTAEMPREVSVALRGPGWHAPFVPRPPLPPLAVADAVAVEREAAAAAAALLGAATAILDAAPIALLKSGGVGAREIKRIRKATGVPEFDVGLIVELATGAGLLTSTDGEALPTPEYDHWLAEPPPAQLAALIDAWSEQLWVRPVGPPLKAEFGLPGTEGLRRTTLAVLAEMRGALPADGGLLLPLLRWHAPLALAMLDAGHPVSGGGGIRPDPSAAAGTAAAVTASLWREVTVLGLVARGAVTSLGRAVLEGVDLVEVAADLVTAPADRATFQADLTAVVSGAPSVELCRLLDSCATREARGAASVWRFTPGSVRQALDAGTSGEALIEALRAAGTLPQAVEYLIHDVARRHGSLRVRAVGCVLHGFDPALLAEVTADRRLAALGLAALAPSVLTSARPPAETLAALRAAGYAPVGEDTGGEIVLEVPAQRRAERPVTVRRVRRQAPAVRPAEAAALAAKLLAAPDTEPTRGRPVRQAPMPYLPEIMLRGLPFDDAVRLAEALENQTPVRIVYVDGDGRRTDRLVEPQEIDGYRLLAYCHLRQDDRAFSLSRIRAVTPP